MMGHGLTVRFRTSSSISYGPTTITKDDGDVIVTNWPFDVTYTTSADPDTVYEYIHNSSPEENPAEPTSRPTPQPPSSLAGSDTALPPEIAHSISTPPPARPRNRQHQQQQFVPDSRASLATTSTSTTPASPASLLSNDYSHPVETSTPTKNGARPSQLPLLQFTDSALPRIKSWRSFMAKAVVFIGTWFALA